jgi:hypoxanthine-DNA glycosylase
MKKSTRVSHAFGEYIFPDSEVLILGTMPSVKSRKEGFYYAHPRNRFFPVFYEIFNEELSNNIDERKDFLKRHKIGLYDVIEECDIIGSSDSSITNVKPIDIKDILTRYPNIKRIGLNGKKAQKLFDKYLKDKVSEEIEIIALPSSSPANAKFGVTDLVNEYSKLFQ